MCPEAIGLSPHPAASAFIDDTRSREASDEDGFDVDLAFHDDELPARALFAGDDAEGPLTPMEDELLEIPQADSHTGRDDLFGLEDLDELDTLFDDDGSHLAASGGDAMGLLVEEEAELGHFESDEPMIALIDADAEDEGAAADDSSFDLVELPPLGERLEDDALFEDLEGGGLFDESLEDFELDPEPLLAPAPPRIVPPRVHDRSPPT